MTLRFLIAAILLAQLGTTSSATAGNCWVRTEENPTAGPGGTMTAKRYAPLRARLLKLEEIQRADRGINALTDMRYTIHRFIGGPVHLGAPLSSHSYVMLYGKQSWKGACDLQSYAGLQNLGTLDVRLNNLRTFQPGEDPKWASDEKRLIFFDEPQQTGQIGGFPVFDKVLVMTADGIPPFVDVTVGEYLDEWRRRLAISRAEHMKSGADLVKQEKEWLASIKLIEKDDPAAAAGMRESLQNARATAQGRGPGFESWEELERMRAAVTPAQRGQTVYLNAESAGEWGIGYATAPKNGGRKQVKINPALWKDTRSELEVRSVTLEVRVSNPEKAQEAKAKWLGNVDIAPYKKAALGN